MKKRNETPKAPAATGTATALAEAVMQVKRGRWNPLRLLTPQFLASYIEDFERGDLAPFAYLAETISDRDDVIKGVKLKREKSIAGRKWSVLKSESSDEATAHEEVLKDFWSNVRATDAYDQNVRGGMGRLVKQMMGAASFRYAVHHIVWEEKDGKLRATFEFVPLWFFENREGILRFRRDASGTVGDDLAEGEWMVTCSDGLMIACAIDYLAKRFAMQDWLAFSEKFSMPGILGRTSAGKGSEAGLAMKSAVENFGQDFAAVVYGDDGSAKIELIQPNGNPSAMPMPAFIERADRKMAALYRGADLSSMSSGRSGAGTGASLQQNETAILETDDCMTISETLQEIDKQVIAWHFGKGVEPRAYVKVPPPARKDHKFILEVIKTLHGMNVRIPTEDALGSLGFTEAGPGVRALGERMKP